MIPGTHRNESWHTATHTNTTFKKKKVTPEVGRKEVDTHLLTHYNTH